MNQEDHDRLVEYSNAFYLGPQSNPSRKPRKRMSNRAHKARQAQRKPTERRAIIKYTTQTEGY